MNLQANSVNFNARRELEEALYNKVAERLIDVLTQQPKEKFGDERLKVLGAIEFSGTTRPKEAENMVKNIEKVLPHYAVYRGKEI